MEWCIFKTPRHWACMGAGKVFHEQVAGKEAKKFEVRCVGQEL
jgi:hypothetical protein